MAMIALGAALYVGACDKRPQKLQVAVIPKGTTHVYWKSVEAGAEQAGKELGIEIIWKGPLKENDRSQQIAIVEQFVADRVGAIVLAPLDDSALVTPVQEAAGAKIPVVIIDSALKGEAGKDFVSYIATDNEKGGELAGEKLVSLLGGKGKVVLLRYQEGSASTTEREAGFLGVIRKNPGMSVLVENRFGGATANESQKEAMNMLDQLKAADGVFCPNESSTFGMLLALRQAGLAGKIKFVGFDVTPQLIDALKGGDIDALVAQDPVKMGYQGVKTAVAAARGQSVNRHIDTGVRIIGKPDLSDPVIQKLIGQ
jgi:ribose transport system substrate-binding protein